MRNVQDNFKSKVIYAFPGMGKTYISKLSADILDTDSLLSKIFNVRVNNIYKYAKDIKKKFPAVYDYKIETLKNDVDFYTKMNKTIVTSNLHLLGKVSHVFLPSDLSVVAKRLRNSDRPNQYNKESQDLEKLYKQVKTFAEKRNIPVTITDNYISDYLLEE